MMINENELLKKLESSTGENYKEALVDLVQLYRKTGKPGRAFRYIDEIFWIHESWNDTAHVLFPSNLFRNEFISYRGESFSFETRGGNPETRPSKDWQYRLDDYFSYCLNLLGRYMDAEIICRENIELYPLYPVAYINLGISLEGQGRLHEAADSYRTACIADLHHTRSRSRFYNFFERHPEVRMNTPEIENITVDERNEFQRMHGSDKRISGVFSGEVKQGELRKVLEECNEKLRDDLEEDSEHVLDKDKIKH